MRFIGLRGWTSVAAALVTAAVHGTMGEVTPQELPLQVGVGCDFGDYSALRPRDADPVFRFLLDPGLGTGLHVLHVASFRIPRDDVVLIRPTNADRDSPQTMRLAGRNTTGGFYTQPIRGEGFIVELFKAHATNDTALEPSVSGSCLGVKIDGLRFTAQTEADAVPGSLVLRGNEAAVRDVSKDDRVASSRGSNHTTKKGPDESLCGQDEAQEAACLLTAEPEVYRRSGPVARLTISKDNNLNIAYCTGFLVGCEGHLLTNQHCIRHWVDALNTAVEFFAEAPQCGDTSCRDRAACGGRVRVGSTSLVAVSTELDYALVKLTPDDGQPMASLLGAVGGYLQLRGSGPRLDEQIYIPQYPMGWGKQIATTASGQPGRVESLGVSTCGGADVGYYVDTQEGSSGAPVLATADHAVIALHHCGGCLNGAIPSPRLIADLELKGVLPRCAVV